MTRLHTFLKPQFLTFILAMLLVPVLFFLSQRLTDELVDSHELVAHTYNVLTHIERLNSYGERIETARRGYVITHQEQYLKPYYDGQLHVGQELLALRELTVDNPVQQQRLNEITPVINTLTGLAKNQIGGGMDDAKKSVLAMDEAKLMIDRFRSLIDEMRLEEKRLLAPRSALTESKIGDIRLLVLVMMSAFLLLLIYSFISMFREIKQRTKTENDLVKSQRLNQATVRNLSLMSEMTSLLQACTDTEESLRVINQFASRFLDVDSGVLYLFRESRNQVEASVSWGNAVASEGIFQPDDCWALRRGEPHIRDHSHHALPCKHTEAGADVSSLCIPIVAQGNVLGTLYLENQSGKDINAVDLDLAKNLCSQIALALASIRLRDTLRNLSVRDPLTGLFNRRYMEESLQREIARAQRKHLPLGVVIFDLDHFKTFNDTFGHEAGDLLLREVGTLLKKSSRSGDIACRFGGEEFVMIYPEADADTVNRLCNKLREEIFAMQLQHFGRSLGQVSASFGIAFFPGHGDSGEILLRLADQALYRAKSGGRNRVEIAVLNHK